MNDLRIYLNSKISEYRSIYRFLFVMCIAAFIGSVESSSPEANLVLGFFLGTFLVFLYLAGSCKKKLASLS